MILINQLSKQTGTPVHTIRYYEKYGLFNGKKDPAVKSNNYTWYDNEAAEKLELIKEAKEVGFTLSEIKRLIDAWYSKRLTVEKKVEVLEEKIKEIDARIQNLKDVKKLLVEGIRDVKELKC